MRLTNGKRSFLPELPKFFDDFLTRELMDWDAKNSSSTNTTIPAVNIMESEDGYLVEMAAPGMKKKDFHIELKNNLLTISSEHEDMSETKEDEEWLHREFSYQSFKRSFRLNHNVVDDANIKAKYENGVLRLNIPKKEEAKPKPPKLISVS